MYMLPPVGLRLPRQTSGGIIVRLNALRSILTAPSATAADLARLITSGEPQIPQIACKSKCM